MNLENIASSIGKTPSYAKNAVLLGGSFLKYWWQYFSSRRFTKNQEFYVVYTNIDHAIPFQPDSALDYWLVNFHFIPISIKLGDVSGKLFNDIRHVYVDIAREGGAAFREVPTIMPHFSGHSAHSSRVAQTLLKPMNCSPSLHTATPFFAYNLGARYFPEREPELRRHIGDVISTIIRTKHHAMIDVAFGMFLSKRTISDKLGLDFDDLESFFIQEQKGKDNIPYEHIYRMYHEINELEKTIGSGDGKLPEIMESYFQGIGLPRIKREQSNCYYDLEKKVLVYSPELKVGRGLL